MKTAIMQPYLFPYLGYYQLVNAVDIFVFFDDVNFITKGWINRNNILRKNEPQRFTLPLKKVSQNRMINEIEIVDFDKWRNDFLKLLEYNYKKAPFFSLIYNWLHDFFFSKNYVLISDLAADSVTSISSFLGLPARFTYSSELNYTNAEDRNGQDKIIRICKMTGACKYINPKNGAGLYDRQKFIEKNIELNFINMDQILYRQFEPDKFVPDLSIIDVLMFNSVKETKQLLDKYKLN